MRTSRRQGGALSQKDLTIAEVLGAFGFSRCTKGSGQSLMGSRHRALTSEQLRALAAGEFEMDNELDGGDVLMEVLAEDSRGGNC